MPALMISITLSVYGYLYLAWLFWSAFTDPKSNLDFVGSTSMATLLTEFLSLHSSGLLLGFKRRGEEKKLGTKVALVVFYSIFALGLGRLFGLRLVLLFLISLWARFFGHQASNRRSRLVFPLALFIFLLPLASFLTPRLRLLFPSSGPWEPYTSSPGKPAFAPPEFLVWGALYYGTLGLREAFLFLNLLRKKLAR